MDLIEEVDVCSSASKRGKYRQEVKVGPQTTRSVPFIIIPMKQGQYRIEVKAAVKDSSLNDGIMRMLRVVVRETQSYTTLHLLNTALLCHIERWMTDIAFSLIIGNIIKLSLEGAPPPLIIDLEEIIIFHYYSHQMNQSYVWFIELNGS